VYGKEHELFSTVKEYDLTTERVINHYKKCTKLSEKQIRQYLLPPHDVWLNAKQAKKLGICDKIKDLK
jgi:ATP-dependent protease ClpP protease subunit